jgi:acetyl esterase/lipase
MAALWGPPFGVWVATAAVASLPLLLALWSRARARKARQSAGAALDEAWLSTARSVLAGHAEDLSMQELGQLLGVDPRDSERWLAGLGAGEQVATRVDDAGELVYRLRTRETADDELPTNAQSAAPGDEIARKSRQ